MEDTAGNVMDGTSLGLFLYILEGLRYLSRKESPKGRRSALPIAGKGRAQKGAYIMKKGIIIMTVAEAIKELKEQNEELLRILDSIGDLEGRVPGRVLDGLIARTAKIVAKSEAIDNSLSEFITQANQ